MNPLENCQYFALFCLILFTDQKGRVLALFRLGFAGVFGMTLIRCVSKIFYVVRWFNNLFGAILAYESETSVGVWIGLLILIDGALEILKVEIGVAMHINGE